MRSNDIRKDYTKGLNNNYVAEMVAITSASPAQALASLPPSPFPSRLSSFLI